MSVLLPNDNELIERVKNALAAVRCLDGDRSVQKHLRTSSQRLLSDQPRRGLLFEVENLHQILRDLLPDAEPDDIVPKPTSRQYMEQRATELWREAECLALRPHSFAALKAIPELQQIIAHTASSTIRACAQDMMLHVMTVIAAHEVCVKDRVRFPTALKSEAVQSCSTARHKDIQSVLTHPVRADLFEFMAPGLRLCLAAEVAAGMLCPGQSPPADAPENAAVLLKFVDEAAKHAHEELRERGDPIRPTHLAYNTPAAVKQLWQHLEQQQQGQQGQQQQQAACGLAPRLRDVPSWPLAPHLDLHMQLPPQQLLQVVGEMMQLVRQFRDQIDATETAATIDEQPQDDDDDDAFASLLSDMLAAVAAGGVEQWGEDPAATSAAAAASAPASAPAAVPASASVGPSSSACRMRPMTCIVRGKGFIKVAEELIKMAYAATALGPDGSGSSGDDGSGPAKLLKACMRLCDGPTSQEQQLPEVTDAASLSEALLQLSADTAGALAVEQQQQQQQGPGQTAANEQQQQPDQISAAAAPPVAPDTAVADKQAASTSYQRLLRFLRPLTASLILRFLEDEWSQCRSAAAPSAAWQQAVPLQVLLLIAQAQQINGIFSQLIEDDDAAVSLNHNAPLTQHKLVAVQKVLGLLQSMRQFKQSNEALNQAAADTAELAAAAAAAATKANAGSHTSSSSSSSMTSAVAAAAPLDPASFFSSTGPLSAGLWGLPEPHGAGVWRDPGSSSSSCEVIKQQQNKQGLDNSALQQQTHPAAAGPSRQLQLQQLAWQVVLGTGAWELGLQSVDIQLSQYFPTPWMQERLFQEAWRSTCQAFTYHSHPEAVLENEQDLDFLVADLPGLFEHVGLYAPKPLLMGLQGLAQLLDEALSKPRGELLLEWGLMSEGRLKRVLQKEEQNKLMMMLQQRGTYLQLYQKDADGDGQWELESNSSSNEEDTEPGDDGLANAAAAAAAASSRQQLEMHDVEDLASCIRSEVHQAHKSCRQLVSASSGLLSPLAAWHRQWLDLQQQQHQRAEQWWNSKDRKQLSVEGSKGKAHQEFLVGISGGLTVQQSGQAGGSVGSSSSSSSVHWKNGAYDYHPQCPLCQEEQQQQQEQRKLNGGRPSSSSSSGSSVSSSPYACFPVSYTDPFLWRRLLWQLLGKCSPAAQAFYAHYLAACPHATDHKMWQYITRSLKHVLWSPPADEDHEGDAVDLQLSVCFPACDNTLRTIRIKQYLRAVHHGFLQGYTAGYIPLAQQVLLSLSPLHCQVLPCPAVAGLCPSSFRPGIGKALMSQLLARPLLDAAAHKEAALSMWHIWWHIGLRRYHARQQQQQGKQHSSNKARKGQQLSIDDMYLDPEARLYAVGFAARQLTGAAAPGSWGAPASSSSSSSSSSSDGVATGPASAEMPETLKTASMMLSKAQARLLAAAVKNGHLIHQACSSLDRPDSAQARPDSAQAGPDPGTAAAAAAAKAGENAAALDVKVAEALNLLADSDVTGGVLSVAAAKPIDLLSPADARHTDINSSNVRDSSLLSHSNCTNVCRLYLERSTFDVLAAAEAASITQPDGTERDADLDLQKLLLQDLLQKEKLVDDAVLTDVGQVSMQAPQPVEAYPHPELWLQHQKRQLQLDHCDVCDRPEQAVSCPDCQCALYCSTTCQNRDFEHHNPICRKLQNARMRYMHCPSLPDPLGAFECPSRAPFKLLAGLLHRPAAGEAGPFALDCLGIQLHTAADLVPQEVYIQKAGELLSLALKDKTSGRT